MIAEWRNWGLVIPPDPNPADDPGWGGELPNETILLGDRELKRLVIRASDVEARPVRWAWHGRIALGYITVVTGEEGLGKSVFAAWQLARMTRGELTGEWEGEPVTVLVIASEDGIADTWRPRLDLAGADLDRVGFLDLDGLGPEWNLRDGIDAIRAAVAETGATFIYIDAALDHMPAPKAGESINSPTFVRSALGPLKAFIREADIGGEFSMHPPKARGASFRDLVQASQAFTAIPRVGLLMASHPEDEGCHPDDRRRVLIRGKGNLGRDPGAIEFRVVPREYRYASGRTGNIGVVDDIKLSGITMADLRPSATVGERKPTKTERAAEILTSELADGEWHPSGPIIERLRAEGLSHKAVLADAKRRAKVQGRQRDGVAHGGWVWSIPGGMGQGHFAVSGSDPDQINDPETLTGSRARRSYQQMTLTQKEPENPIDTVRVSGSVNGGGETPVGGQGHSADPDRARAREAAGKTVAELSDADLLEAFPGSEIEPINREKENSMRRTEVWAWTVPTPEPIPAYCRAGLEDPLPGALLLGPCNCCKSIKHWRLVVGGPQARAIGGPWTCDVCHPPVRGLETVWRELAPKPLPSQ